MGITHAPNFGQQLFLPGHTDDLLSLHSGDLDDLDSLGWKLFSPAVSHFLHGLSEARAQQERKMFPPLADMHAMPASGLGKLMVRFVLMHLIN